MSQEPNSPHIYYVLMPAAWLYGAAVGVRNELFDHQWLLHTHTFRIPTIGVGNLAVGGTGKTPHVEWLLRLLLEQGRRVAVVSRGYGRKTKGLREVRDADEAKNVGDEPLQIKHKFPQAKVVVDADRSEALERLQDEADVCVLDDCFQHRYVKPSLSLLLTDYHRLFTRDALLPAGRLREQRKGAARADIIVVTKCPADLSREEADAIAREVRPTAPDCVAFSTLQHGTPYLFGHPDKKLSVLPQQVVLFAGIANPQPFVEHWRKKIASVETLLYRDHINFSATDLVHLTEAIERCGAGITTEKDAARLPADFCQNADLWVQPVAIEFLFDSEKIVEAKIRKILQNK